MPVSRAIFAPIFVVHHGFRMTKQHNERLDMNKNSTTYPSLNEFMLLNIWQLFEI